MCTACRVLAATRACSSTTRRCSEPKRWHSRRTTGRTAKWQRQANSLPDYFGGFQKERYAMAFMGPWALNYAFGKKPGGQPLINFDWGAVLTPRGPKSRQAVMASTGLVIAKHSRHKSAAFWLARFDSEGNGAVLTGAYGVDMPGAKALWRNPAVVKEYGKSLLATIRKSNSTGRYSKLVPEYDKFWNVISTDLQPFWQGQAA